MLSLLLAVGIASLLGLLSLAVLNTVNRSREDMEYSIRVQRRIDHIANTR
jgi:type II secretory pathway component PulJ